MKSILRILFLFLAVAGPAATAKDQPITLAECPEPVQAVVRHYSRQVTFESISLDEKKKSGGPAVYEARFIKPDGKRIEAHISKEGKVLQFEDKKPKT